MTYLNHSIYEGRASFQSILDGAKSYFTHKHSLKVSEYSVDDSVTIYERDNEERHISAKISHIERVDLAGGKYLYIVSFVDAVNGDYNE